MSTYSWSSQLLAARWLWSSRRKWFTWRHCATTCRRWLTAWWWGLHSTTGRWRHCTTGRWRHCTTGRWRHCTTGRWRFSAGWRRLHPTTRRRRFSTRRWWLHCTTGRWRFSAGWWWFVWIGLLSNYKTCSSCHHTSHK